MCSFHRSIGEARSKAGKPGVSVADIKALAAATRSTRFMDGISVQGKYISLEYSIIINDDLYTKLYHGNTRVAQPLNSPRFLFQTDNYTNNNVYY